MRDAFIAGIGIEEFYRLTLGEITVAIEGYHERERQTLVSRVNAVLRGLSTLGKKKTDPFKGLGVKSAEAISYGSLKRAREAWLWRKEE